MDGKFKIDLRKINLFWLKEELSLLPKDIYEAFEIENSNIYEFERFEYLIAYLSRGKFAHIAYFVPKNDIFDIEILEVGIPDEKDIRKYWCKREG